MRKGVKRLTQYFLKLYLVQPFKKVDFKNQNPYHFLHHLLDSFHHHQ